MLQNVMLGLLALALMAGAYFVGHGNGDSVGFETARKLGQQRAELIYQCAPQCRPSEAPSEE
jgi:hypothetical protein